MSYVPPPIPERWDVGQWDKAHWDGQLGLTADAAAFTLTGIPVTLSYISNKKITAAPGSFALVGTPARLAVARRLVAQPGSIAVTGIAVTLSSKFTAATGTFTLSGSVTRLAAARVLVTYAATNAWDIAQWDQALWDGSSTFIVKGYPANLVFSSKPTLLASTGAITIGGVPARLTLTRRPFSVQPGAIVLAGYPVTLTHGAVTAHVLAAAPGLIVVNGWQVSLLVQRAHAPPVEPPWSINETMPPGELVLGIPAYIPNRW
jgi:hypothetical protein